MEKDLKDKNNFTKDLVRKPTEEEVKYVNKTINKQELIPRIFFAICTIATISVTVAFVIDIFTHIILDYSYISVILALFFATFAFCFVYDAVFRITEFLQIRRGNFMIADGKITKIAYATERYSMVMFKSENGFEDELKYQIRGKTCKVDDAVLFIALFNKKDELQYRNIILK